MGRFSDIDIDTRAILEYDADMMGLCEEDKQLFVAENYHAIANELVKQYVSSISKKGNKNV